MALQQYRTDLTLAQTKGLLLKNEKRPLCVRPIEWLKLNFASCVIHQTRSLGVLILYFQVLKSGVYIVLRQVVRVRRRLIIAVRRQTLSCSISVVCVLACALGVRLLVAKRQTLPDSGGALLTRSLFLWTAWGRGQETRNLRY